MWLSRTIALRQRAEQESTAADMGVTTIGGGSASVMTKGEQRDLEVFAPGGLAWQPKAGDTVLVVKGGTGCQEQCVVAAETAGAAPEELAPALWDSLNEDNKVSLFVRYYDHKTGGWESVILNKHEEKEC